MPVEHSLHSWSTFITCVEHIYCTHGVCSLSTWSTFIEVQSLSAWGTLVARVKYVHCPHGRHSLRTRSMFIAHVGYVHWGQGVCSMCPWSTFIERVGYIYYSCRVSSLRTWSMFITCMKYVHCACGVRLLRTWSLIIVHVEFDLHSWETFGRIFTPYPLLCLLYSHPPSHTHNTKQTGFLSASGFNGGMMSFWGGDYNNAPSISAKKSSCQREYSSLSEMPSQRHISDMTVHSGFMSPPHSADSSPQQTTK